MRAVLAVGWLCLLLIGCGGQEPERAGHAAPLRLGWAGSPDALHPGTAVLAQAHILFELVYDALFHLDMDGRFAPNLTKSWSASADGRTLVYELRDDAFFHDGKKLTARDVVFSYNFYKAHPEFPLLYPYTQHFKRVEVLGEYQVQIELAEAIPNIESQLAFLYILSEHIWAAHAEGEAAALFANEEMVGSGPFKLVEYRQSEFVLLAAHKEHPLRAPQIDELVLQTFASKDALVQALRIGQVDAITEIPQTALATLRRVDDIEVLSGTPYLPEVTDIIINQVAPENCPQGGICSGHPALRDREVRRALASAIDKQQLIDVVLLGLGVPGLTLLPQGLDAWYNDELVDYSFDPALARRVLDEAGYVDADGDGIRQMPDGGAPLNFRLNWPADMPIAPRMAQLLTAMWTQVGIGITPQSMDADALSSACCPTFDYDLIIWGWTTGPDPSFLLSVMSSERIASGGNESGYASARFDSLYDAQRLEVDAARRQELVWELQRLVHEEVAYIIPFYPLAVQAYRTDRFGGWPTATRRVGLETPDVLSALSGGP